MKEGVKPEDLFYFNMLSQISEHRQLDFTVEYLKKSELLSHLKHTPLDFNKKNLVCLVGI